MAIYEMVHEMPGPLVARCFPVLVVTAAVSEMEFLVVTLPVDLRTWEGAWYSNGRNVNEGSGKLARSVVLAEYCAVERVRRYKKTGSREGDEEIEWVMATASHARGNLPMTVQKMGVPGAIAKDVGLFMKWVRGALEERRS